MVSVLIVLIVFCQTLLVDGIESLLVCVHIGCWYSYILHVYIASCGVRSVHIMHVLTYRVCVHTLYYDANTLINLSLFILVYHR